MFKKLIALILCLTCGLPSGQASGADFRPAAPSKPAVFLGSDPVIPEKWGNLSGRFDGTSNGGVILIDEFNNRTVAAGMITN